MEDQNPLATRQAASLSAEALALAQAGRLAEAEQRWRMALLYDKSSVAILQNLGVVALQTGRAQEALTHFAAAEALTSDAPELYRNKAMAHLRLGQAEAAITALQRLLALRPGDERGLHELTQILMEQQRSEDAVAVLRAARDHKPVPVMLATLLKALGRVEEARAVLEPALASGRDYYLFADLTTFEPGDPKIATMETLLHKAMPPDDLAALKFALAKAYSDSGMPEKGFALFADANRLMRRLVRYDEAGTKAFFARVAAAFTPALLAAHAAAGHQVAAPIIILGMPRSGTTLVEQILASHPAIAGAGENAVLPPLVERYLPRFPDGLSEATDLKALAGDYLAAMGHLLKTKPRVVDKTLDSALFAGLIHLAMPKARFIWVRRDPVDTCLSCYVRRLDAGLEYSYDLGELGRYHRSYEALMTHWQTVLPAGVLLTVRYEEVVADLEGQTRRLLAHCGEVFDPACLAFHRTERPVYTASAVQVRQPLYRTSIGRWRPPPEKLRPLLQGLGLD